MRKTGPVIDGFEGERVMSQGIQAASGNWERQDDGFFPRTSGKKCCSSSCLILAQ